MEEASLFLSAGDPSGDNAAARLIRSLTELAGPINLAGLGGARLKKLGQRQLAEPDDLAVLGFWEVAKQARFFKRLLSSSVDEIRQTKPNCVVLIDYPGFNLRLAKRIKPLGIPIVYYITPQVWAWHKKRVHQIRKLIDKVLVILPFEEQFFREHGVESRFVGHYLLEDIPAEYIASPAPQVNRLCLMPGSRPQEIERMLLPMLRTARMFNKKYGTTAVVAAVKGRFDYEKYIEEFRTDNVELVYDDARRAVAESSLVLTASGTATLEAAIIGRPIVVVYKTGSITYHIAKRLVKLDNIGLVNLVLGEKAVPELIQSDASPEKMMAEFEKLYNDEAYYHSVVEKLRRVPQMLGGTGASRRAAELIAEYLS